MPKTRRRRPLWRGSLRRYRHNPDIGIVTIAADVAAAREPALPVAGRQRPAQGRRDGPGAAADVEDLAAGAVAHADGGRVAGHAPGGFRGDMDAARLVQHGLVAGGWRGGWGGRRGRRPARAPRGTGSASASGGGFGCRGGGFGCRRVGCGRRRPHPRTRAGRPTPSRVSGASCPAWRFRAHRRSVTGTVRRRRSRGNAIAPRHRPGRHAPRRSRGNATTVCPRRRPGRRALRGNAITVCPRRRPGRRAPGRSRGNVPPFPQRLRVYVQHHLIPVTGRPPVEAARHSAHERQPCQPSSSSNSRMSTSSSWVAAWMRAESSAMRSPSRASCAPRSPGAVARSRGGGSSAGPARGGRCVDDVDGAGPSSADMNHSNPPYLNSLRWP